MNIFLTLDYEIFFGEQHGSVQNCMIKTTNLLLEITKRTGARMTYFIDIGHVLKLEEYKGQFPELEEDYLAIKKQVKELVKQGNDCQLHIHPHWEDTTYQNGKWKFDISRYKLSSFSPSQIDEIVGRYKSKLEELTQKPVTSYRAGGWCLQPFNLFSEIFNKHGLKLDSTVFKNGVKKDDVYFYDFSDCPDKTRWLINDDLTKEDKDGDLLEIPISSYTYKPFFFWQLFGWGKLFPSKHKPLGKGYPLSSGGDGKKKLLTQKNTLPVSLEGYFAKKLPHALKYNQSLNNGNDFVVIGHPKALTLYSVKQLEKFINKVKNEHTFKTFSDVKVD